MHGFMLVMASIKELVDGLKIRYQDLMSTHIWPKYHVNQFQALSIFVTCDLKAPLAKGLIPGSYVSKVDCEGGV